MTDHQFYEAKKLVDSGMSIRKAAEQVGVNHSTLIRWLRKEIESQAATVLEPVSEAEDSYRHALIRRHENETRKGQGLPPLTAEEWAVDKAKLEECERQMDHIWLNSNDN